MYYEEKIIDGVLCFRTTPKGEFKPMSSNKLTDRLIQANNNLRNFVIEKNTLLTGLHKIASVYDWEEDFAGKTAHEVLTQFDYSFNENGSIVSE